ncbi:tetratricopeptide repeat protein [Roseicyclus sp.]|uniref:tetratricopeptide repeat protein n=1 Tax=Roseicyclus sp. TaxID=1914329 RepID=UPI003F6B7927
MRIFHIAAVMLVAAATMAAAVGLDDDAPPTPTPTTTICPDGQVWDIDAAECVPIDETGLVTDPARLIGTARELAYAGRHDDVLALLARASDQDDTMVQTYMGYSLRSMGDMAAGLDHYARALAADPDNLLARSYLGMAHLIAGKTQQAAVQLAEIRARGGAGRWPERALAAAIAQGTPAGYDY